jgi:hypothetical protein
MTLITIDKVSWDTSVEIPDPVCSLLGCPGFPKAVTRRTNDDLLFDTRLNCLMSCSYLIRSPQFIHIWMVQSTRIVLSDVN